MTILYLSVSMYEPKLSFYVHTTLLDSRAVQIHSMAFLRGSEQRGQRSWQTFTMRLILAHKRHGSVRRTSFDPEPSEWADHHLPLGQKLQRIPGIPLLQLQRRGGERTSHRSLAAWEKTASPGKELYRLSARNTCAVLNRVLLQSIPVPTK